MLGGELYKDLLDRLGVQGHEGAIAEINALRLNTGLGGQTVHTLPHFTRTELQTIGTRAHELAAVEGLNPEWRQVYEQLALAASILDAFLARAELPLVIAKYAPAGDETGRPKDVRQTTLWDWDERPTGKATYDTPSEAH